MREVGISAVLYGLVVSASGALSTAVRIPASVIADRADRRILLATGLLFQGVLITLISLVKGFVELFILLPAISALGTFSYIAAMPMMAEAGRGRGMPFGIMHSFGYTAGFLGAGISAFISEEYRLSRTFLLAGLPLILISLPILAIKVQGIKEEERTRFSLFKDLREMRNKSVLLRFCAIKSLDAFAFGSASFIPMLGSSIGFSYSEIFSVYSLRSGARAIISLAGGFVADRIRRKWLYVGTYVISTLYFLFLLLSKFNRFLFPLAFVVMSLNPLFVPGLLAYTMDSFPREDRSKAIAIEGTFTSIFGTIGPSFAGIAASKSLVIPFLSSTSLEMVALMITLTLP
ncbi:MAG TPA: MFS transporter [Candidatus Korarchaeota archaeon]|nr:MFS transporter [Candidatus Korarchaeota archaeon]